jgi:hypothetical protein
MNSLEETHALAKIGLPPAADQHTAIIPLDDR